MAGLGLCGGLATLGPAGSAEAVPFCLPSPGVVHGTSGDDVIHGTSCADIIYGHGGDDVLYGAGGNDVLHGGAGADELHGGDGSDRLLGEQDADVFYYSVGGGDSSDALPTESARVEK